jgi:hypothetical protein
MKTQNIWKIISVILASMMFFNSVVAQTQKKATLSDTGKSVDTCEDSTSKLSSVKAWYILEKPNANEPILIIGYLSERDSRNINRRRLQLAQKALIKLGINKDSIVLAEGITKLPLPKLDFFVKGKIVDEIVSNHNLLFCIECCSR